MKHSIVHTNRQLCELLNLPDNTVAFTLRGRAGELPTLEIETYVGIDQKKKEIITKTQEFKLELIPKTLSNEPS